MLPVDVLQVKAEQIKLVALKIIWPLTESNAEVKKTIVITVVA